MSQFHRGDEYRTEETRYERVRLSKRYSFLQLQRKWMVHDGCGWVEDWRKEDDSE